MNKKKYILAIETSCDDTSIAISCNDHILSNVTLTSLKSHKQYGGIVPEIAARGHEADLSVCYKRALKQAKIRETSITHVAYTASPGLPGSLHVGKVFAKSIASLLHVPLILVDHMMGHIYSFAINNAKIIKYPFLALVVSGGHTAIYLNKSIEECQVLNQTADDAMGETLDKIGRILKLNYPGGISVDKIYNTKKTNLKMINHFQPEQSFSFSGVKTHIFNFVNQSRMKNQKVNKAQVASSLLNWMVEEVMIKLNYYIKQYPQARFIAIGGGVSANKLLRRRLTELKLAVKLPENKYTNDNAAMIAAYAYLKKNI